MKKAANYSGSKALRVCARGSTSITMRAFCMFAFPCVWLPACLPVACCVRVYLFVRPSARVSVSAWPL